MRTAPSVAATLAIATLAHGGGGVTFFDTQAEFDAALNGGPKQLVGVEDFEDMNVGPDTGIGMNDFVDGCTDNSVLDPGTLLQGIRIQSNTNGTPDDNDPGTEGPNPYGSSGLVALGPSSGGTPIADRCIGVTTLGVGFNSLDVMTNDDRYTAMWLRLADTFPTSDGGPLEVRVYDADENLLGMFELPGENWPGVFVGFIVDPGREIGRVNVWGPGEFACCGANESVYELGLYADVPPCQTDVDGNGVVDVTDMLHVLGAWGGSGPLDFNGNGIVDVTELLLLLSEWGPC